MKILLTAYEVEPFYKRGGLGDVMGSLPIALSKINVDARVVMPYYDSVEKKYPQKEISNFQIHFNGKLEKVTIRSGTFPKTKVPIYFLENKNLISVVNLKKKKVEQFVFFDLAVGGLVDWLITQGKFIPDIIHCHDWHTALIPVILKTRMKLSIPTILTIHNLMYQGKGSFRTMDILDIDEKNLKILKKDSPISVLNALGEGILHASYVSTVSPTYAKQIESNMDKNFIYGFLERRRKEKDKDKNVYGIINGIDYDLWNPYYDKNLFRVYNSQTVKTGKLENKNQLLHTLKLPIRPTCSFVGRMADQKGLDVIKKTVDDLIKLNINVIFLGTGMKKIEKYVGKMQEKYPDNIYADFKFDEVFAHRLYAASDFILIPSHYEPCGLIQMIAMRYGTIPIASDTGGLHDTIKDGKDGFLFTKNSSLDFIKTVKKAVDIMENEPEKHMNMVKEAIKKDFSWDNSAKLYKKLYEKIISENNPLL